MAIEPYDVTLLDEDEQPSSGEWVDSCDLFENLTDDERSLSNEYGAFTSPNVFEMREFAPNPEKVRAQQKAQKLKEILLKHGVPEVHIDLREGRPSPYGSWDSGFFVADMSHHTVSRYSTRNLTPCLNLCVNGRSDLPGPLCNGYGGWDLTYRIITFGYANHPGEGGPYTVPALTAGHFQIPKDSARRYTWGTEWEGGLDVKDWDKMLTNPRNGKKMTFREFMGRTNAALEEFLEIHKQAHLEHSSWTSRKIDRLGYNATKGIAEKEPYRKAAAPDPVKPLPKVDLSNVREQFRNAIDGTPVKALSGVKQIQKALNAKYKAGLKVDGIVGKSTIKAWKAHETQVGVKGRPGVPDKATLSTIAKKRFQVVK